jgi:acetyl-CoA C-acetyltransferase
MADYIRCIDERPHEHAGRQGPWLTANKPEIYWSTLQTAEEVAKRYGISRERQDEYGVRSQQRAAAAREAGRFDEEIVPMTVAAASSVARPAIS